MVTEVFMIKTIKKSQAIKLEIFEYGAADGARTRDPRRDRPVF